MAARACVQLLIHSKRMMDGREGQGRRRGGGSYEICGNATDKDMDPVRMVDCDAWGRPPAKAATVDLDMRP
jgi:hypothetical protein